MHVFFPDVFGRTKIIISQHWDGTEVHILPQNIYKIIAFV